MESSPFNRSGLTRRSPPPTPARQPPPPAPAQDDDEDSPAAVSTVEIQNWMKTIEHCLNEVCVISSEGKLNSEQKLRISNLCRKVGHGTSQMAVQYQSLKQRTVQLHCNLEALKEKQDLSKKLHDLKQSIEESSKSLTGPTSYAQVVKQDTNSFIMPSKVSSIAVYPSDKLKSSEDTKSMIQKIIKPQELKLHVRGLRKTKNGGVIISTDSKEDIDKLKKSTTLSSWGFTIDEPNKRNPRITIIGVPTSMQETEVFISIYEQNLDGKLEGTTLETFLTSIKLSHKSGKRDGETCNFVLEVPALIRKALIKKDRVFVNWSSCPVRDFTLVTRCFKCQQYGHAAKTCREEHNTCGHCGDVGHTLKDCTKKSEKPKCATCLHFKKPCDHKTGDTECPAKKNAEKRLINSTDYDGCL